METKGWDVFRVLPPETDSSSENIQKWLKNAVKILKVFAYLFTFCMVLVCGVVTKITTLFMTSQIKLDRETEYCNHALERGKDYVARIATQERVAWTWCIFFAFIIPELGRTQEREDNFPSLQSPLSLQAQPSDPPGSASSSHADAPPSPTSSWFSSSRRCTSWD